MPVQWDSASSALFLVPRMRKMPSSGGTRFHQSLENIEIKEIILKKKPQHSYINRTVLGESIAFNCFIHAQGLCKKKKILIMSSCCRPIKSL